MTAGRGYTPGRDFDTVFGVHVFNPDITLGAAVALGGGVNALTRHGVAALLNAANGGVNDRYTTAHVVTIVRGTGVCAGLSVEARKDLFAAANEAGSYGLRPRGAIDRARVTTTWPALPRVRNEPTRLRCSPSPPWRPTSTAALGRPLSNGLHATTLSIAYPVELAGRRRAQVPGARSETAHAS